MSTFRFLSPEWVEAAKAIRDEYADRIPPSPVELRANVVVTETPFEGEALHAYVDTSTGELMLDLGRIDDAEIHIRIDYETARRLFVARDQGAAMEAFFSGRLVVEGDITKVLALSGQQTDPVHEEIATRISAVTSE